MAEALAVPSVVIVLSRFQPFRAETVSISNTTYIAKRNILIQTKLTFFQNHFTASGSPVDLILPKFGESVDAIKDFENKVFGIR